jgi:glycosyltransferase involved in cell wall biosynthesis
VGDGPLRREAENEAPGNVSFVGTLPATVTLARVKAARFLIFPSVGYETFGMTVLEAAACGVATVGTRLGAIPELIHEGQTGLLFDPHDSEEMAEKVAWVWSRPRSVNEMGAAARRRYLEHYTADKGYEQLARFYGSVSAEWRTESLEERALAVTLDDQ